MAAFIASFALIFFSEMGDKTQLLALAFASRYKLGQVLTGVFVAILILNAAAVGAGKLLVSLIPFNIISIVAALAFIGFGIWTLKGDDDDNEDAKESGFGPVLTVTLAFLLAELGDKTQLATIGLAVQYSGFFAVLCGSVLGMFLGDAVGIFAGGILKKYVSEKTIRLFSAALFIIFGIWSLINIIV